jgi:hypothetical protein
MTQPEVPKFKQKNKVSSKRSNTAYLILLLAAGFLFYRYFSDTHPPSTPVVSKKIQQSPSYIVVRGPPEILAGDCFKLTVTVKEPNIKSDDLSSYTISATDIQGTNLTLYSGPKCGSEDNPTLSYTIPESSSVHDLYAVGLLPGKINAQSYDHAHLPIITDSVDLPPITPNTKKLKLSFKNVPSVITEYQPFSVSVNIADIVGNPISSLPSKVSLSLIKLDTPGTFLPLKESTIIDGVATFNHIIIEDTPTPQIQLSASIGDDSVKTVLIPKALFVPRTITIQVEGMQRFAGKLVRPGTVELFGKTWKINLEGTNRIIDINNRKYVVEVVNPNFVRLKKFQAH